MTETVLIAVIALGGPLVGFLGSVLGSVLFPWIRDRIERKRVGHEQVLSLMWEFHEAGMKVLMTSRTRDRPAWAGHVGALRTVAFNLVSLLKGPDAPLAEMVEEVVYAQTISDEAGTTAMAAFQTVAPRWLNGTLTPAKALDDYNDTMKNVDMTRSTLDSKG